MRHRGRYTRRQDGGRETNERDRTLTTRLCMCQIPSTPTFARNVYAKKRHHRPFHNAQKNMSISSLRFSSTLSVIDTVVNATHSWLLAQVPFLSSLPFSHSSGPVLSSMDVFPLLSLTTPPLIPHLVLLVPDTFTAPRHRVGDGSDVWLGRRQLQPERVSLDELGEDLGLRELREPRVHDLVQQLVLR